MAVKDVLEYYNQVTTDYISMREELQDMEKLLADQMIAPEMVEQMKQMVQPIKVNYETLSYFMFLLNKPGRKQKQTRYNMQNKKLLEHSRAASQVLEEDQQALQNLRSLKRELQ